jgi:hypothetical protein
VPRVNGEPTEAEEQAALFEWAKLAEGSRPQLRLLYAVPNGGSRHRLEAANLKRQGVKAGVPDLCLAYPKGVYHGLYIEMKVGKNKPSEKQQQWLRDLKAAGYMTAVCYGFLQAKETIERYLNL